MVLHIWLSCAWKGDYICQQLPWLRRWQIRSPEQVACGLAGDVSVAKSATSSRPSVGSEDPQRVLVLVDLVDRCNSARRERVERRCGTCLSWSQHARPRR